MKASACLGTKNALCLSSLRDYERQKIKMNTTRRVIPDSVKASAVASINSGKETIESTMKKHNVTKQQVQAWMQKLEAEGKDSNALRIHEANAVDELRLLQSQLDDAKSAVDVAISKLNRLARV